MSNTASSSYGRCLTCYICGQPQIAVTIEFHLDECKSEFVQQQRELPQKDRQPLPEEPKGLRFLIGIFYF